VVEFHGGRSLRNDLKYESETGRIQDDAIAPWATATTAVLDEYREFMQAFSAHFAPVASSFVEINISLGPTGELRYPAYNGSSRNRMCLSI
jgi:hypothetical protein